MAGISNIDICNLALTRIGQDSITDFADGSIEAQHCSNLYDFSRRATLRAHPWNFATETATLAVVTGVTNTKFTYTYQLPADCVRVLKLVNPASDEDLPFEVRKEKYLVTNTADAEVEYVTDVEDTTMFDDMFVSALGYHLASELAIPVAGSKSLKVEMRHDYLTLLFNSKGVDASEKRAPLVTGQAFVDARK